MNKVSHHFLKISVLRTVTTGSSSKMVQLHIQRANR